MFQTAYAKFGCVASRVCGLLNNNGRTEAVCDTADRETNRPATLRTDQSMDDGKRASTDQCNAQAIRGEVMGGSDITRSGHDLKIIETWDLLNSDKYQGQILAVVTDCGYSLHVEGSELIHVSKQIY